MRRPSCLLLLLLLSAPTAAAEGIRLPDAWRAWAFARPVIAPDGGARLVRVPLDLEVLLDAQPGLRDLRVLDAAGLEVPYLLEVSRGELSRTWRQARMSDRGFLPGRFTEAVVDVGPGALLHNSAELRTDEEDFFAWVSIATSEDRETWKLVRDKAPVYRFETDGLEGNRTLPYPDTRARWLRLRILDPEDAFRLDGVRIAHEVKEPAERLALAPRPRRGPPAEDRSVWTLGLRGAAPISGVRFRADGDEFHRPVVVRFSDDGETWRRAGQGDIYRQRGGPDEEEELLLERLEVELPDRWARHWRVEVLDRDDRPVAGLVPLLLTTHREVVYAAEGAREAHLLYGNPGAPTARYDLARVTARRQIEAASTARLGKRSRNTAYVSAEPWTERHPAVLWGALIAAVAVLGLLALRALRGPAPRPDPS